MSTFLILVISSYKSDSMLYDVGTKKEPAPKKLSYPRILKSQNSKFLEFGAKLLEFLYTL